MAVSVEVVLAPQDAALGRCGEKPGAPAPANRSRSAMAADGMSGLSRTWIAAASAAAVMAALAGAIVPERASARAGRYRLNGWALACSLAATRSAGRSRRKCLVGMSLMMRLARAVTSASTSTVGVGWVA